MNLKGSRAVRLIRRALAGEGRLLHQLVFGTEPGRGGLDIISADWTPRGRLLSLLGSNVFVNGVAAPALDGLLVDHGGAANDALHRFVRRRLGVSVPNRSTRLELLADVIEVPAIAKSLARLDRAWSLSALSAALRGRTADPSASPTATSRAQSVSSGVLGLETFGLKAEVSSDALLPEAERNGISLLLQPAAAGGDYVRLDFGLIGGEDLPSRLTVEYEGRSRSELDIFPRGRSHYAVVLADPARIRRIVWAFGAFDAPVRLRMLTARPRTNAQMTGALRQTAGEWALPWLDGERLPPLFPGAPEPIAARLSRQLTRRLGGHMSDGRRSYVDWLSEWEPTPERARTGWLGRAAALGQGPVFGVLLPVEPGDADAVLRTLESVARQVYARWTLRLSLSASLSFDERQRLAAAVADDVRFRLEADTAPDASLADRMGRASGRPPADWTIALGAGDILAPQALLRLAEETRDPAVRLIYADHDHLDGMGARERPAFKPDWSPETLLSYNYILRPAAVRIDALESVDGRRPSVTGAEAYDLLLHLADNLTAAKVRHVPEVLAHLAVIGENPSAEEGSVRAKLDRRGDGSSVERVEGLGRRIRHVTPDLAPWVSLIMPTRDRADLLIRSVGTILDLTGYERFDLTIVDNGSEDPETLELLQQWSRDTRVRVLRDEDDFNFSRLNNRAAAFCSGEVLGLVNNDIEIISPDWMGELAAWAVRPEIGCVGAKLLFPDGRVQHGGVVLGIGGTAAHAHKYAGREEAGYGGRLRLVHNVSAVTAACLFVRRSVYLACGGLNEALPVNYNDVDFCLKVSAAGYRNVMVPHVELYHHESASRGEGDAHLDARRIDGDAAAMAAIWGDRLLLDPYYSPNLTQVHENFDLRRR